MTKNIVIITLIPALVISTFLLVEASSTIEELRSSSKETTTALNDAKMQLIYERSQIKNINRRYDELKITYDELKITYDELKITYDELKITSQFNKFLFYYTPLTEKITRVRDLEECLSRYEWKEDAAKIDIFDCSEMSAVLERMLENEGFHTFIVSGKSPYGGGEGHAWLIVEISPGEYIPVEAVNFSIIPWDNPYINEYHSYDNKFETIHEALNYPKDGYDWWEQ